MFFPNDLNSQESLLFLEPHCHYHELFYLSVTSPWLFYFNSTVYMVFLWKGEQLWLVFSILRFLVVKDEVTTFTLLLMLTVVLLSNITRIVQL